MSSKTDAIKTLEAAKTVLQAQAATATDPMLTEMELAIDDIANEISALVMSALADYAPRTDPFKAVTAEAKAFVTRLNHIKAASAAAAPVLAAIDKVIGFIK